MNNKIGGEIITFKYRYKKQIIIGIVSLVLLIGIITTIIILNFKESKDPPLIIEKKQSQPEKAPKEVYKVDIKGEVNAPGIYELENTSRIIDVIEQAGGLTEQADTSIINLSKKITDEMVIIIYSKEQVKAFGQTKEQEKIIQQKCQEIDENYLKNDACIATTENSDEKVSINIASKEELMTLPGIGESKAQDIIEYREKNGPFTSIEDLTKVSGIGENIFAKIKENITL